MGFLEPLGTVDAGLTVTDGAPKNAELNPAAVCADPIFYARVGGDDTEVAYRVERAALDAVPG